MQHRQRKQHQRTLFGSRTAMLAMGILIWISMAAQPDLGNEQSVQTGKNESATKLGQLPNMRKETEAKLNQCTDELKSKKQTIAKNDQQLLDVAMSCIIAPYNENMINWVGVTAFDAIQDPDMKEKHEVLYTIMVNQTGYVGQLQQFFREYGGKPVITASTNNGADNKATNITANDIVSAFEKLPVYQDYLKLGSGWERTYLGKFLTDAHQELKMINPVNAKNVFSGLSNKLDNLHIK